MKCKLNLIAVFFLFLYSCQNEIPMVNLGINDVYTVERMKKIIMHPEFPGQYEWSVPDKNGNDSLVSTERDYIFLAENPGEYFLKLRIIDPVNPVEHDVRIVVWEEQVAYSRYITQVYEYRPAPGQFINTMPMYKAGDTEETMRRKAQESISGTNDVMISLGGFGGYVTFGFDHTVVNVPGEKDFKIIGNAFYAVGNPNPNAPDDGGSVEPGIVMVSLDRNGNGISDDEWYELAGSEYYKSETMHHYEITYDRPSPDKSPTPKPETPFSDTTFVHWEDNQGKDGYIVKNIYHKQEYYPKWISAEQLTFSGTKLANNVVDESGEGIYFVQYAYDWGYVDNHPNEQEDKISFDIGWAVDKNGNKVHLPGVDFIRVYTGLNQQCGWLGETSTELSRAEDLHIKEQTVVLPDP
ncbi:MAG: cell surface protein [Candidatus Symbiothrix sp.]|nr:cell surface protein [Candidatus Symbiothrix sp.]